MSTSDNRRHCVNDNLTHIFNNGQISDGQFSEFRREDFNDKMIVKEYIINACAIKGR